MSTIIEIVKSENSVDGKEMHIIHNSFHNSKTGKFDGICQLFVRLSDFESEGHELFMDFQDDIFERTGDYIPICLDKPELKQLIDFLTESYNKLP